MGRLRSCGPRVLAGVADRLSAAGERKLSRVSAQPTEDPADPLMILRDLPEREREEFLRQYHRAVDAAHDPAGYQQLLSGRALKQIRGLPGPAFDSLIAVMAEVIDYPGDPLRTFPTSDPCVRRVESGDRAVRSPRFISRLRAC